MIAIDDAHPYKVITGFILRWIDCLVRGDFEAADGMVDEFEGDTRIGDYFSLNEVDQYEAVDPVDDEWWQISFNPSQDADKAVFVEAYVPLTGDYRPLNACFLFVPVANEFKVVFQHCTPS